jgi:hypothetical protein
VSHRKIYVLASAFLILVTLAGGTTSPQVDDSERNTDSLDSESQGILLGQGLVDDLLSYFSSNYEVVAEPRNSDNLFSQLQSLIGTRFESHEVEAEYHYFKSSEGREVRDYEGKLYRRTNVAVLVAENEVICDSLWNTVLFMMWVPTPLPEPLPKGVKSPPMVLIEGERSIVVTTTRCEDLLTEEGVPDVKAFWRSAEEIASLARGCQPERLLACGCGGPLVDLTDADEGETEP